MTNFADRTIWTGDNLDILRGLNSASVDLIYLDPPFNSNRNYAAPVGSAAAGAAFKDTWTLSDLDVAWMGLIADELSGGSGSHPAHRLPQEVVRAPRGVGPTLARLSTRSSTQRGWPTGNRCSRISA